MKLYSKRHPMAETDDMMYVEFDFVGQVLTIENHPPVQWYSGIPSDAKNLALQTGVFPPAVRYTGTLSTEWKTEEYYMQFAQPKLPTLDELPFVQFVGKGKN